MKTLIVINQVINDLNVLWNVHKFMIGTSFSKYVFMIRHRSYANVQQITFNSYAPKVMVNLTMVSSISQLFWNINRDMYGQTLKISFYDNYPRSVAIGNEIKGAEGWLIELFCNRLNATYVRVLDLMEDGILNQDPGYKAYLQLISNYADINFNLQRQTVDDRIIRKYNSYPRMMENLVVLLPNQERSNNLIESLKCFNMHTKCLYLISIVMLTTLWYIHRRTKKLTTALSKLILDVFGSAIMVSISQKHDTAFGKLLLASILWINFVFYSCYQTFMVSNLMEINYEPHLKTFEELNNSGIKLMVTHAIDYIIIETQNRISKDRLVISTKNAASINDLVPKSLPNMI